MGDGIEELRIELPCLLTVTKDVNQPRLPSYQLKEATKGKEVHVWDSRELKGVNSAFLGLDGSPTQVEHIFPPLKSGEKELWEGNPRDLSQKFYGKLKELKYL